MSVLFPHGGGGEAGFTQQRSPTSLKEGWVFFWFFFSNFLNSLVCIRIVAYIDYILSLSDHIIRAGRRNNKNQKSLELAGEEQRGGEGRDMNPAFAFVVNGTGMLTCSWRFDNGLDCC
ncbi:hypothetical protein LZ31DRAFT_77076 [Colletotrichum somersetense]|nr:hypothetical protein LZ31DRAFT_77076 [Colletotrichum somersetense]